MSNPKYKLTASQHDKVIGEMTIETFPDVAPKHAANFDKLVADKFYDGTAFHRVIPGFMIQGGDGNSKDKPRNTWGFGDPKQKTIKAEFNDTPHKKGIISAARSASPDSASTQFFICINDAPHLDGQYTVYGKVVEGFTIAEEIVAAPRDGADNPHDKIDMTIVKIED